MKFKEKDILFYVSPCVFTIEKIQVSMGIKEMGDLYYIDHTGAYLKEEDLFYDLTEAKGRSMSLLNTFYGNKVHELISLKEDHLKVEYINYDC